MQSRVLNRYRELFWDAFHVPNLSSQKFTDKWKELESINEVIAGPLFSVFEKGECDYIFADKDRFDFNNEEELFEWMVETIREYAEKIAELPAENQEEEFDLKVLMYQCDIKMELAELSREILRERK
jgi:hypothetical protein